ncbi:MAG: isoprenylcysteine carboxylmethyltransferase family protein [Candidatus Cloacimonetes bacterium]|nr:isoprenylcysteine carboxylmethyltransferase family protein [Candidatus Cloacimonadota bacterium]
MNDKKKLISSRVIFQLLLFIFVLPFLPLLISWHWSWWEAWVYGSLSILSFTGSRILAARRHPDLISERSRLTQHENAQVWDKKLLPLLGSGGILVMLIAGLDALLDWSHAFSMPVKILALVIMLAGYALSSSALIENRFFSGTVRLQTDRGHKVISTGPYHWLRHPGYAGAMLVYLATPLFLDSTWAFLPAIFTMILYVIRTAREDRFLQDELVGYRDYVQQVRYLLLPGVW